MIMSIIIVHQTGSRCIRPGAGCEEVHVHDRHNHEQQVDVDEFISNHPIVHAAPPVPFVLLSPRGRGWRFVLLVRPEAGAGPGQWPWWLGGPEGVAVGCRGEACVGRGFRGRRMTRGASQSAFEALV